MEKEINGEEITKDHILQIRILSWCKIYDKFLINFS